MIFEFKNLGPIEHAEVEMGKLTILGGKNNTGKTYVTYAVWGMMQEMNKALDAIFGELIEKINQLDVLSRTPDPKTGRILIPFKEFGAVNEQIVQILQKTQFDPSKIFNTNKSNFKHTRGSVKSIDPLINKKLKSENMHECAYEDGFIFISLNNKRNSLKEEINALLVWLLFHLHSDSFYMPFLLTAQRDSIFLFQKEIDRHNAEVLRLLRTEKNMTTFLEKEISRFAQPIEQNIDFIRNLDALEKEGSWLSEKHPEVISYIEEAMLGIRYEIKDNRLFLVDKKTNIAFPQYLASTSVRTLASLHLWLKHEAHFISALFIDEPEMSLHPANQIKMARLLVRLANAGIRVWITTHSDYIIKEINNCLMLANDFEGKEALMQELGYTEADILKSEDLRAYIAQEGRLDRIETDSLGMMTSAFDEAISQINNASDKLAEAITRKKS